MWMVCGWCVDGEWVVCGCVCVCVCVDGVNGTVIFHIDVCLKFGIHTHTHIKTHKLIFSLIKRVDI